MQAGFQRDPAEAQRLTGLLTGLAARPVRPAGPGGRLAPASRINPRPGTGRPGRLRHRIRRPGQGLCAQAGQPVLESRGGARPGGCDHDAFSHSLPAPLDVTLGQEVIFIVCLPRSGSTLTEQTLASHPQVDGADEVQVLPQILIEESGRRGQAFHDWVRSATAEDWQRLGHEYLARTRRWRGDRSRFTDKNVDNWAFVGAALAMLPGARVVNSRRDPLETCFALYRQLFGNGSVHYGYDLDGIVDYYGGYARLSRLWQQRHPPQYFDHDYEALQSDPEAQVRRLRDFCGPPFDPACLAFHQTSRNVLTISAAQVRQPSRRDTERSTRYGGKLDLLRAASRGDGRVRVNDAGKGFDAAAARSGRTLAPVPPSPVNAPSVAGRDSSAASGTTHLAVGHHLNGGTACKTLPN